MTPPVEMSPHQKVLTLQSVNSSLVKTQYAVRGKLAQQADVLRASGRRVTSCNIGNPQQLNQKPITFFRQVLALVDYPDLLLTTNMFPSDAKIRAQALLKEIKTSGAYSHSQGILSVRENVAKFIENRDGFPSSASKIFLTAGASPGVQNVLSTIIQSPNVGIMIPIPQYPLYSASVTLFNGVAVPYYLDEAKHWSFDAVELARSLKLARANGTDVRALCVINPGNPTGQCLSSDNIKEIIKFCHNENLVIIADEVYQTNVYIDSLPFHSFKKALCELGDAYKEAELISFHSVSKGMVGECGRRGGYFECTGIHQDVLDLFYKMASLSLCPPVPGQIMVDLMVNPPKVGDESYTSYQKEIQDIYASLKSRAEKLSLAFNLLDGVTCNNAQGAMYLFPQIRLPAKAIQAAKSKGVEPDELYCMELLDATGVCMVGGSGFLQVEGTFHFRSTFLPPAEELDEFISQIKGFHESFMNKYH